jgi:acetoin utilization deacetylase AcuC-like enzyme
MHSFYGSDRVLFFSTHQYPFYPGTGAMHEIGEGAGKGYTVNVPLPPGQGDAEFTAIFQRILVPIALQYRPQMILVSAGFDIARGDPLAEMLVTAEGFSRLTRILLDLGGECCPGRLVFTLEGGYSLTSLAGGVSAVLETLVGRGSRGRAASGRGPSAEHDSAAPNAVTADVIDRVAATLGPYWKLPG